MTMTSPFISRRGLLAAAGAGAALGLTGLGAEWASAQGAARVLRLGFAGGSSNDNFDPHAPNGQAGGCVMQSVFEQGSLVGPDFVMRQVLFEEITPNATLDEWTVRLKDGVEFHHGKTLAAEDLLFTLQRILDPASPGYAAGGLSFIDLNAATVVDSRTVRFKLAAPTAFFEAGFGDGGVMGIIPTDYGPDNMVGTGPYRLRSFVPGQQIELEKFANYWGDAPQIDEVIALNFNDDFARVNALMGGQIDALNQLPLSLLKMLEGREGLSTLLSETGLFNPFSMRCDEGPFKDNRIRQAFRMMINREQVIAQAFGGHATVCHDLYSPFDPDYDAGLQRAYDPEQARALLKEAGAEGLEVELIVAPVRFGIVEAAQVLVAQAAEIGVTINLRRLEPTMARSPEVVDGYFSFGLYPGLTWFNMCSISDGPYSTLNSSRFSDPEFTALYDQVSGEADVGKRHEMMQAMQKIQFERGGLMLPAFPKAVDAFSTRVGGLVPDATGLGLARGNFAKLQMA